MNWRVFSSDFKTNKDQITSDNLKLKFALQVSNIGIWDFDMIKDTTTFSEESAKIVGLTSNELNKNSDSWNNLVHADDREMYFSDFQNYLRGEKELYENISRIKHSEGGYRWVLDKGKILEYTKSGKPKRIIGVHVDITDSKKKEDQISESVALITKQNKTLKNFAHIAAHNLKEHSGNFESLLELYQDTDNVDEKGSLIENLNTVSATLKNTIDNLREIITINSVSTDNTEPIKLKSFCSDIIKRLKLNITDTQANIKNNIDNTIVLNSNKLYLESIFQNLLSNSLKYAHPRRHPNVSISSNETADSYVISIADNGLGIDLDTFGDSIFGLYKTFHKNKDAEGVGLYITKNQVEALGGTINVASEVNVGTEFVMTFPK